MKKSEIRDKLDEGGLLVRAIIEMVGKPKEHIEKTLYEFVQNLKTIPNSGFTIIEEDFHEATEQEESDSLFGAFCDLEIVCDTPKAFTNFCFEAMPSSVEVTEPENLGFRAHDLTDIMNDFVARMHQVDAVAKRMRKETEVHLKSLGIMIQNAILILLNIGPRDAQGVAKYVGIDAEQIQRFLNKLEEDGKVEQADGKYKLKKGQQPSE